jgi:Tfp pilus assembly PilM family ATPase
MARKDASIIGIDLHDEEIRVVQVAYKGGKPTVLKAFSAPMTSGSIARGMIYEPGGTVSRGTIYEPASVSLTLRRLLETSGIPASARAVIGVSSEGVSFRTIAVPPCSPSELPVLVAGEVEHLCLVPPGGAYDFIPLFFQGDEDPASSNSVSVVAADGGLVGGLRDIAEQSGLQVEAFEPTSLAILRTAAQELPSNGTAFVLSIGTSVSDTAFFLDGQPLSIRRIDIGGTSLIQTFVPSPIPGETPETSESAAYYSHIDESSVMRLALEVQRTLEYVQRDDPERMAIDRVYLAVEDAGMEALVDHLAQRLGLPVSLVTPPANLQTDGGDPLTFSVAYGLATYSYEGFAVATPRVDLYSAQRSKAKHGATLRNFWGAIAVSGVAVALGVIGCFLYGRQIARMEARSKDLIAQTKTLRDETQKLLSDRADDTARYRALRKEGIPVGTIMDYVVSSIDPTIGLKFVAVGEDNKVRIAGEAKDEAGLVRATQNLQRSAILTDLRVDQFMRDPKKTPMVLAFELSGMTVTADRLKQKDLPQTVVTQAVIPPQNAMSGGKS